jgi:hypothetical protein
MANTNTPYIAKAAGPLANPTSATLFLQLPSPIATVAATQVLKVAYATYRGYNQYGTGISNPIDLVRINVKASGRATYGAAGNHTPTLVIAGFGAVTPSAPFLPATSVSTIGGLTAQAASAAGTGEWTITADLTWNPATGVISGSFSGQETVLVAGAASTTLTASTAITPLTGYIAPQTVSNQSNTVPIAIPAPTGELALLFAVTSIFSASNASNVAVQDMLQTEEL